MRAFLTVVPGAQTAIDIERWCNLCWPLHGRKIPVQNFHMTVAFLGDVDENELYKLSLMFNDFSHSAFEVVLNTVGYWSHTDVLYLGTQHAPDPLHSLHIKCRHAANRLGARGSAKRYEPHITLARKLVTPPPPALIEPDFKFEVRSLQLWSSVREAKGARYRTVVSWDLNR